MAYEDKMFELLNLVLGRVPVENVIDLGVQVNKSDRDYGQYVSSFYESRHLDYKCIDINGENDALKIDMSTTSPEQVVKEVGGADLVVDAGFSEHIKSFYNVWAIKHEMCRPGGCILSENPKRGHWAFHGIHYLTIAFYIGLAETQGYQTLIMGESLVGDEMSVYCAFIKAFPPGLTKDEKEAWPDPNGPFISEEEFLKLDISKE